MRLLLHAITTSDPRAAAADAAAGLGGRRLRRIDTGNLVAWASEFPSPPDQFTRADLLKHHEIISRLHAQVEACLPARFATWMTGDSGLERRAEPLTAALERVRDRSELAVTALWTSPLEADDPPGQTPPPEAATPGTRYLRDRQHAFAGTDRRRARARELADEIERGAGQELVEAIHSICPSPAVALSAALLVPRGAGTAVRLRLLRDRPGVRILVNGPWPPYTFADVVLEG
jgi:hypothetical protein